MSKFVVVFVIVTLLFCNDLNAQNTPYNPCPNIFQYGAGNGYGIITVNNVNFGQTDLEVELTQQYVSSSNYAGKLSLNVNQDEIFGLINMQKPFTYIVEFPNPNVLPYVTRISLNGVTICSGRKPMGSTTTITLKHTLNAPSGGASFPSSGFNTNNELNFMNRHSSLDSNVFRQRDSFGFRDSNQPTGFRYFSTNNNAYSQSSGLPYSEITNVHSPQGPSSFFPISGHHHTDFRNSPWPDSINQLSEFRSMPSALLRMNSPTEPPKVYYTMNNFPNSPRTDYTDQQTDIRTMPRTSLPSEMSRLSDFIEKPQDPADYLDSICGKENDNMDVSRLAVHGEVVAKSRFPWIVALYKKTKLRRQFLCGGSLISTQTVISSAHCFIHNSEAIPTSSLFFAIGRHNLSDWNDGQSIYIKTLIKHPDFKPEVLNFDADIAIAILQQSVSFSLTVRPICLWQGSSTDVRDIEGAKGIVVGWGEDETPNVASSVPKLVNATIVSDLTCIRSNSKLLELTSNRTFCAGNRDGSGPCLGDSGSGLMLRNRNRWTLRGIVAAALGTPTVNCLLDEYVIYLDVAKFMEWIDANILL